MPSRRGHLWLVVVLGLLVPAASAQGEREKVLIRAAKPYTQLVARIEALGGSVTYQYTYVNGVAAEVPRAALGAIRELVGPEAITKDLVVPAPTSVDTRRGREASTTDVAEITAEAAEVLDAEQLASLAAVNPQAYAPNNGVANVSALHSSGFLGTGSIVAVIDSGIRPGFPHISLDGSVIGCEDFVGDALGCSNSANNGHGTFVAGMISANVNFTFAVASTLRNAVLAHCPTCFSNPPTNTVIPMIGTAPLSSIYALRVFPPTGGAPTSRILAAVERAITLRERFNAGLTGGQNIRVVNMSLGGPSLFPGRDLFDRSVDALIEHDIVPVISAGNAGPSSLTMGSPGSAFTSLTVGAASLAHNERILRELQLPAFLGPGRGAFYRPFSGVQTAYFSSRGPSADGRTDPDVVASGLACYGQGLGASTSSITLGSGTSFAAPAVAGVAAVLRQRFPAATARQIRNAIIATANPSLLSDGSTPLDQGAGYVDASAAAALLASGMAADTLDAPGSFVKSVKVNVEQRTALQVRDGFVSEHVSNLKPGERYDVLYRVAPNTKQVLVGVSGVTPALPAILQNPLFGDDILLTVHTAKTSAIGEGDYPIFTFTGGGQFAINNPETGLMRVTLNGDWTNAGSISAHVTILSLADPIPQFTLQGKIAESQLLVFPVNIPAGVSRAEFRLSWREDWGNYPTSDVDLLLINPSGAVNFSGATLSNPEVVGVNNPSAGTWILLLNGFEVHGSGGTDKFDLRVTLDGRVIN